MSYDPGLRRETPLARKLIARISAHGPISLKEYMSACLQDPEHGYYRSRPVIGREGDFVTAPEISQIFGELIGLWSAVVWQQMGSPQRINLIELGPGRGTLLRDALRAARLVPDFAAAVQLHLVESSEVLRQVQARTLADIETQPRWHTQLKDVPNGPAIIIGNEFLDALPADQLVRGEAGWRLRSVTTDAAERLQFDDLGAACERHVPRYASDADIGTVFTLPDYTDLAAELSQWSGDLAALFIDYGHTSSAAGDTLQAVRDHRYEHPLTSPGEADLTTQVDFGAFADQIAEHGSLAADGPVTQAEFLGSLGIIQRASKLMAKNPEQAGRIEADVARLLSPGGMGTRFKVIGMRSSGLPPLPGF